MENSEKWLSLVVAAIMVISVCAVIPTTAANVSVIRDLPDTPINPNEEITVTLTQDGFFLNAGFVTETLPKGFEYVEGSSNAECDKTTNKLRIDFAGKIIITYVVKAEMAELENAVFSGTWTTVDSKINKICGDVKGDTALRLATITIAPTTTEAPPSVSGAGGGEGYGTNGPPTVTRFILPYMVSPGDKFLVLITFTAPQDINEAVIKDEIRDPGDWNISIVEVRPDPLFNLTDDNVTGVFWGEDKTIDRGDDVVVAYLSTVPGDAGEGAYYFAGKLKTNIWDPTPITGADHVTVDTKPPYTEGHDPAPDATNVPVDTNLVVHVKDDGAGVNRNAIAMAVQGEEVTSDVSITGDEQDYALTYNPPENFSYGQVVNVTIDASDLTGKAMPTDSYSFTTEAGVVAGSIAGKITYTCNTTGIAGVSVNLTNLTGVVKTTTTNATGYYDFKDATPGNYSVNASKPRFWGNSMSVTVTVGTTTTANMKLWLKGDLNGDGFVNVVDIAMLRQAVAGLIASEWYFDLNDDGFVNVVDIAMLRQAVAGLIVLV